MQALLLVLLSFSSLLNPAICLSILLLYIQPLLLSFHPSPLYSPPAPCPSIRPSPLYLTPAHCPSILLLSTQSLLLVLPSFSPLVNPYSLSFHPSPLHSNPTPRSSILLSNSKPLLLVLPYFSSPLKPYSLFFRPSL